VEVFWILNSGKSLSISCVHSSYLNILFDIRSCKTVAVVWSDHIVIGRLSVG